MDLIDTLAKALFKASMPSPPGPDWEDCKPIVRAVVKAAEDAGFVLVPKEPTADMLAAVHVEYDPYEGESITPERAWPIMLAVAPKP